MVKKTNYKNLTDKNSYVICKKIKSATKLFLKTLNKKGKLKVDERAQADWSRVCVQKTHTAVLRKGTCVLQTPLHCTVVVRVLQWY